MMGYWSREGGLRLALTSKLGWVKAMVLQKKVPVQIKVQLQNERQVITEVLVGEEVLV